MLSMVYCKIFRQISSFFSWTRRQGSILSPTPLWFWGKRSAKYVVRRRSRLEVLLTCVTLALKTADWEAEWRQIQIQPIKTLKRRRKTHLRRKNISCRLWLLYLPFLEENLPLWTNLWKAKAIKPSKKNQYHQSKKAFKFNFVLISQNTNLWKTSFGKNFIPNGHISTTYMHATVLNLNDSWYLLE